MPHHGQILRRARESAGLKPEAMGALVDLSAAEVRSAEESAFVHSSLLENYAEVFGLTVRALLRGDAEDGPAALLFRSMTAVGSRVDELTHAHIHRVLGRFMQVVRHTADLRTALAAEQPRLSAWPPPRALPAAPGRDSVIAQAERLAIEVRRWLGIGDKAPIASARAVVQERFGVDVFFVDIDTLAQQIDGASTLHPSPAILVNLIGGPTCWWRIRMTLMHELCHLLFDRDIFGQPQAHGFLFFSPELDALKAGRWRFVERFADAEQRANAFAACLLAPSGGVRDIVGADGRPHPCHVAQVQAQYGIGRTTALNRLQDVCSLSDHQRRELARLAQPPSPLPLAHPDVVAFDEIGLRSRSLRQLVATAVERGAIDGIEARRVLGLDMSSPIPGIEEKPMRPPSRGIADAAVLYAQQQAPELGATFARRVRELPAGGFEVEICGMTAEGPRSLGVLKLSKDMEIENSPTWRGATLTGAADLVD